ncbi:methyltransferase domain-containing protein [Sulfuricurvum sp.]|uniref:class I SAM-dependent methyltransferase n=1 Tax=Sulfuricurvum sp. TaxID=2025608 RepID=UPI00262AD526|nr:methyltransferase domain-containing protein [Sulfuricurvum sp.]MDD3596693.1 hypothetical protein [Sulfuricurvum sp.]
MAVPLRGFEREKKLLKQNYYSAGYFDKYQLFTFAEQITLLYNHATPESKILEIGKGNGFISDYFKKAGYTFQTFDINPNLEPDITGNVLELSHLITDFPDIIFCCEVLEHMDFTYFEKSLEEMQKVAKERIIITLPNCRKNFGANLQIRLPKRKVFSVPLFIHTTLGKNICPEHCWELNYTQETSSKNIEKILEKYFVIEDKGYFHTNPYHNYYVLKKLAS